MRRTGSFLTRSHRTMWDRCKWWSASTYGGTVDYSKMVHEVEPSGYFTSKGGTNSQGYGAQYEEGISSLGKFAMPFQVVTIVTNDDVEGLAQNDLVLYHGEIWIVAAPIRKIPNSKASQFTVTTERTYIITLRNGGS